MLFYFLSAEILAANLVAVSSGRRDFAIRMDGTREDNGEQPGKGVGFLGLESVACV
jgi:hypothetical protein